jgi:signal peptidase I
VPEETVEDQPAESSTVSTKVSFRIRHRHRLRLIVEWAIILVDAVLVSLLMRTYVVQTFYIPSASMEPTLNIGDRIIVSKLSADLGTIHRGDIVVFKAPPAEHCGEVVTDLVKRVIGVPGDRLKSVGNTIYYEPAGGHTYLQLHENWSHWEPLGGAIANVTVAANRYFVMGDNHSNSCDSRMWGTVPKSDIIGKVFLRIWPLSRLNFL